MTDQLPLDDIALRAIAGTQQRIAPVVAPRLPMSKQERDEVEKAVKDTGICLFCAGIHAGLSGPACPRLASGKLNGDGTVVEFTFWNEWNTDRVVFPEDIDDEDEESGGG